MNTQQSAVLDYTLHDLYNLEETKNEDIVLVYAYAPPVEFQLTSSTPPLSRFPVQSPLCPIYEKEDLALQLFHGTSQRFGFCSGPMSIAIFDLDRDHDKDHKWTSSILPHHTDTYDTFKQLPAHQMQRERGRDSGHCRDCLSSCRGYTSIEQSKQTNSEIPFKHLSFV